MDFRKRIDEIDARGLLRQTWPVDSSHGEIISIRGQCCINFASNNYLGLAGRPEVCEAVCRAVQDFGWGSGASRLMSGTHRLHEELEARIAAFKETESALVFNSGYAANIGTIPALCDDHTTILSDELNHASLIDGIRLGKGTHKIYRHRDAEALESLLKQAEEGNALVVSDGVFSMDGDVAPLPVLMGRVEEYGGLLYLDDAHGTGIMGADGRGTAHFFGVQSPRLLQMGTLSKALGSVGGFIAGSQEAVAYLRSRARPFIFSTSLPPPACAAGIAALGILEREGRTLRRRLGMLCSYLAEGLERLGLEADPETPIFPIRVGSVEQCLRVSGELRKRGIFSPGIRPPTVAADACRIRVSLTAAHNESQLDQLLDALGAAV